MALLSVSKASKLFEVSRPTLQKALKDGLISGEKVKAGGSESWQIDTAELARLYTLRSPDPAKADMSNQAAGQEIDTSKQNDSGGLSGELAKALEELNAELAKVQAQLEEERTARIQAETLASERKRVMDEFIRLLPKPEPEARRGWWSRLRRR